MGDEAGNPDPFLDAFAKSRAEARELGLKAFAAKSRADSRRRQAERDAANAAWPHGPAGEQYKQVFPNLRRRPRRLLAPPRTASFAEAERVAEEDERQADEELGPEGEAGS